MRRTRESIVGDLQAKGLSFHTFVIEDLSPHALEDWKWNHHDVPHIASIHSTFSYTHGVVDDDLTIGLMLRKLFGVTLPVVVTFFHDSPDGRVWMEALGPFVLVTSLEILPQGSGTRAINTYSIGGPRWAKLLLRASERVIRGSFRLVHGEDARMLARRTWLRERGFTFAGDGKVQTFSASLNCSQDEVRSPPGRWTGREEIRLTDGQSEWLVGESDHLGLRIVRRESRIEVFPRMCHHHGASLDGASVTPRGLQCPWHGRVSSPWATFDLTRPEQTLTTPRHRLTLANDVLRVEPLPEVSTVPVRAVG